MLVTARKIKGLHLSARDGAIGTVKDLYFDSEEWIIRYLVVDTGGWLRGRKVLVSPVAAREPDWEEGRLPIELTREQVEHSPGIELDEPVSRQHEALLHQHYGWPVYWAAAAYPPIGFGGGVAPVPPLGAGGELGSADAIQPAVSEEMAEVPVGDPHLHSMAEVQGYRIAAVDGAIGHVEDFLTDVQTWRVTSLLVDTRNWWPGRTVLVAPEWIREVFWERREVQVDLARHAIRHAPEFDPGQPVEPGYLERLHHYYRHQFPPRVLAEDQD
jgi:hypothetical protein